MDFKGIDVSSHNGIIDWDKVKPNGIDFAMLRCGIGNNIPKQDDSYFNSNVDGCEKNGISWGTYLYSYALSLDDAQSEVDHVLRLIDGKKPSYPVIIDMEDTQYTKEQNKLCADICYLFCSKLTEAGYLAGVYANKDWLENRIDDSRLKQYETWLAQWTSVPTYRGEFGIWQYSSKGRINGINGDVDLNISYKDYPSIIKENGLNGWSAPIIDDPDEPGDTFKVGDLVYVTGMTYADGKTKIPAWVKTVQHEISKISGNKVLLGNPDGINSWVMLSDITKSPPNPDTAEIKIGDRVYITGTNYATGENIPAWVKTVTHVVSKINGSRALLGNPSGINSWVFLSDLRKA